MFRPKLSRFKRLSYDRKTKRVFETQYPESYFLNKTFTAKNPLDDKFETYECGEDPEGEAHIQFHFQYYMYAIIFIVFDVLIVFMMAWALVLTDLNIFAKMFMFIFIVILTITVIYALKKEEVIWI